MKVELVELKQSPQSFFQLLPEDWQDAIVPFWENYKGSAKIYTLTAENKILGGGIAFSSVSPDTEIYYFEAQNMLNQGYLYLGFLWVNKEFREKGLGSLWLKELFKKNPGQKYWLSIEDFGLASFYIKNGFNLLKQLDVNGCTEWIMIYEPSTVPQKEI